MSKRKIILDLLKENELTTEDIQEKTGYDMNLIQQYINQFKKEFKIKKVGKRKNFIIYRYNSEEEGRQKQSLMKLYDALSEYINDKMGNYLGKIDEILEKMDKILELMKAKK